MRIFARISEIHLGHIDSTFSDLHRRYRRNLLIVAIGRALLRGNRGDGNAGRYSPRAMHTASRLRPARRRRSTAHHQTELLGRLHALKQSQSVRPSSNTVVAFTAHQMAIPY